MTPQPRKKPDRRPDALSRERIVTAAIDALDTEGETGLTFRVLSERLSTGPGAIYWHVAGKAELLAAATEHIVTTTLGAEAPETLHTVALSLFEAVEAHPWLASQMAAQLSQNPSGPVAARLFETVGRQVSTLNVPVSSWFTATSALLHYILGAAAQNAANVARARAAFGPSADRRAYFDAVSHEWKQLSPQDYPFIQALAGQAVEHDDRTQFLAGIDLIIAGATAHTQP